MKPSIKVNSLKNWGIVVITLIFLSLYIGVLLGWLKPFSENALVMRLEPILFFTVGYYFANLPAQKNLVEMKDRCDYQTKKAEAAQSAREQAEKERIILEGKIWDVRKILVLALSKTKSKNMIETNFADDAEDHNANFRHSVKMAIEILNSKN
ncbi:MAG: hypothetical protein LUM44_18655 [Pyrinomonadaceae bacterium]|nr:hypothetical protein [Pyrinomonadaceae bacterium]